MTVVAATTEYLILQGMDTKKCVLRLAGRLIDGEAAQELSNPPAVTSDDSPIAGAGGGLSQGDFSDAIQRVDESHYQIDSEVIQRVLENGGDAVTEVDLAPHGGGTRLGARSGVFAYLGLQDGDILMSANARPITSVDDLVSGFGVISDEEVLHIKVQRAGKPLSIEYRTR